MKLTTIDIHSHLTDTAFDEDREAALSRMAEAGVGTITIGTDFESSERAVALAALHNNVWASVGVHPDDGGTETFSEEQYAPLLEHGRVVAVGECGFDYFRKERAEVYETQRPLFEAQIEFALAHDLPLMLHIRDKRGERTAYEDTLSLLSKYKAAHPALRGNAHFFAMGTDIAERFFALDFTISFTGVITFTSDYDEVVSVAPLEQIHAETDAPYVAPKLHRGARNEPSYVTEVVKRIAEIKKLPEEQVAYQLRENARKLFYV